MAINNDVTIRTTSVTGAREIKASAHYAYGVNGVTLDGSKFAVGELVLEGQALVMDNTTKMYEKYTETTPGTFEPLKSNPVILDESVKFFVDDAGANPDVTVGQCMVHGAVYTGMCIGLTTAFKAAFAGAVRFI